MNRLLLVLLATTLAASAQNPVPQIVGPVHPDAVAPGSGPFTLSVYGANFVPGSVVNWNYQPRVSTYVSGHEIQAQILASDVESNTAGYITVTNPAPGGGSSSASWAQVEVHNPISTITLSQPQYSDFGIWQLVAADFTNNAILDLVGENQYGLGFMRGSGEGTFVQGSTVDPYYLSPLQAAYGDFNNDGNLDVVDASTVDAIEGYSPTYLDINLGNGDGTFTPAPPLKGYKYGLWQVLTGDFNRDGNLDLVTSAGTIMSLYLGRGDGSFVNAHNFPYADAQIASQELAGDFNGDGKLDLILLAYDLGVGNGGPEGVAFWFVAGNGDGTFQHPQRVAAFAGPSPCVAGGALGATAMKVSDFNGDGKLDIAFCNDGFVGVMLGNGDGTFQAPNYYSADPAHLGLFTFAVGDINSDGKPDLIVSEFGDDGYSAFVIFLGNGDGTFQAPQTLASGDGELGIVLGDLNSDGLLDAVFVNGLGMDVFLQTQ